MLCVASLLTAYRNTNPFQSTMFNLVRARGASSTPAVCTDLMDDLHEIGRIKNDLPLRQRGWCNELGLFVQLLEADGERRLKAEGKYRSKVDSTQPEPSTSWTVKSFERGKWESLAAPTLDLARWLGDRQGLPGDVGEDFRARLGSSTAVVYYLCRRTSYRLGRQPSLVAS